MRGGVSWRRNVGPAWTFDVGRVLWLVRNWGLARNGPAAQFILNGDRAKAVVIPKHLIGASDYLVQSSNANPLTRAKALSCVIRIEPLASACAAIIVSRLARPTPSASNPARSEP